MFVYLTSDTDVQGSWALFGLCLDTFGFEDRHATNRKIVERRKEATARVFFFIVIGLRVMLEKKTAAQDSTFLNDIATHLETVTHFFPDKKASVLFDTGAMRGTTLRLDFILICR